MRDLTIYIDVNTWRSYDAEGTELTINSSPSISYKEQLRLHLQYLTAPPTDLSSLDKYLGFVGLTLTNTATIDNNWNHYDAGALNAGRTGVVTDIPVKSVSFHGSATEPRLQSGEVLLINGAGEQESVAFTAWSLAAGVYTFTVSTTLTYTYLEDDVVRIKETPIIRAATGDIDQTDKDTGLFLIDLDGNSQVFQALVEGRQQIANTVFAHIVQDAVPSVIFTIPINFRCFGILDDDGVFPPAPTSDYYTKTQCDTRYVQRVLFNLTNAENLQISGGVVAKTATSSVFTIEPQSGTTDDLDTITGGAQGGRLVLFLQDPVNDTITIKHALTADEIATPDGQDYEWSGYGAIQLHHTGSYWQMVMPNLSEFEKVSGGTQVTITDDTTTNIILGNKTIHRSFFIDYTLDDGTNYHLGKLTVSHDGTSGYVKLHQYEVFAGVEMETLTWTADISGDNVRLKVQAATVGSSPKLVYEITKKLILST